MNRAWLYQDLVPCQLSPNENTALGELSVSPSYCEKTEAQGKGTICLSLTTSEGQSQAQTWGACYQASLSRKPRDTLSIGSPGFRAGAHHLFASGP